jgi:ketosteroid isomerase-like protein
MKKNNGVNIMIFVFITVFIVILSCVNDTKKSNQGVLLKTDREFSATSVKEGMFKAFLEYIADDGVILRNNSYPDIGKNKMKERFSGKSDTSFVLSWEPLYEKISENGDLGYTYGIYSETDKNTGVIYKGTYVSIWEKQGDRNWKYVLDTGTEGLPEK